jgi:ribose transport system substrate-binding protein
LKRGGELVKKNKAFILIMLIIVVILGGFITKSLADDKPKVIVVLDNLNIEYWNTIKAGAEKGFRDFGIEGKVLASKNGTDKEIIEILKGIQKEKPDALIVSGQSLSYIPELEKFVNNKIPVLLVSTDLPWVNKTSYIGTNNIDLGETAGAFIASQLQPGDQVALIGGDPNFSVFAERIKGNKEALKEAGIDIAVERLGISDEEKTIKNTVTKMLRDYPSIKGVIVTHDTMALEVLKEIKNQGLNIPVIGADGTTEMIDLILNRTIPGTVAQNPYDMGYLSVETALKVTQGEKVDSFIDSGVDIIVEGNAKDRHEFLIKLYN